MVLDLLCRLGSEIAGRSSLTCYLLLSWAGWRRRGSTPAPSSRPQQPTRQPQQLPSQLLSTTHANTWGGRRVTRQERINPVLKPSRQKTPLRPPRGFSSIEPQLHSNYFSGKAAGGWGGWGGEKREHKMYNNRKTHN